MRATAIASQVPTDDWHAWFPDATMADAVLDRLVHQAYRVTMDGESMRKVLPTDLQSVTTEPSSIDPGQRGQELSD